MKTNPSTLEYVKLVLHVRPNISILRMDLQQNCCSLTPGLSYKYFPCVYYECGNLHVVSTFLHARERWVGTHARLNRVHAHDL